ncbi:MAG TPA: glycosyltransferase [Anaerolineales bacterium]|nr:glycosyltransferase [Anaerolineales bacterium]
MKAESVLPECSLIICSRNRPKLLFETVESVLLGQDVPTELIIVDQSTTFHPQFTEMKTDRPCEIRYIHTKTIGIGTSRNLGINTARFEILIFIDDDMFVEPDWFGNLVRGAIKAGPYSVVTGQVLAGVMEVSGGKAPSIKKDHEPAVYNGRIGKDVLYTGNMAAYRSMFDCVGLFDERLGPGTKFPAAEDNDLGFRLLEQGYCICYVPEAIVYHRAWRSERENLLLKWNYGVGRGAYYSKHMSWRDPYMFSRMIRDVKGYLSRFLGDLVYRRRLTFDFLCSAFGIFYGVIRWRVNQLGRHGP